MNIISPLVALRAALGALLKGGLEGVNTINVTEGQPNRVVVTPQAAPMAALKKIEGVVKTNDMSVEGGWKRGSGAASVQITSDSGSAEKRF